MANLAPIPAPIPTLKGHHSVPYGQAIRQWMTDGELVVWVNQGHAMDAEHSEDYFSPFQVWDDAAIGGQVEFS